MRHFKSIEEIKEADVEKLTEVPEIPRHIAEGIYGFFHQNGGHEAVPLSEGDRC